MYLKSLVLKGFKSFADRSVLALEPGLTVVVGPNGSGKSNISDSILWVLGEQSAKHLRGQSMQDVIFSGSSARKAVSVAEVSLVLDNADRKVPLEYDEIAITRRMYRSGESEYLVNGAPALLRDIQDILHDSGLGRNTSSIISQGTLSDVLDARDEDRRALIEEAAGILKHKRRKERSARRIESMDASLTRVKDVMKEIDRQLRPLERQARRARQYTAFEGELRQLELSLATDDLRDLQARWDDCVKREKELQAQVDIAQSHLDDRDAELEKYQHILQERGLYVGDLAEQRRRCQSVIERLDASMLLLGEKGNTMVSRTSELRSTIHRSRSRLRDAAEELEPLRRERAAARQRLDALVAELAKLDERGAELAAERKRSDAVFEQLSSELRSAQRGIGECNAQIERYRSSAASLSAEDDLLASRLDQISDLVASDTLALDKMRSRLAELETHAQESACEHDKVRESIESQDRTLGEQRLSHEREQEHHADVVAELRGIEEVDHMLELSDPMRSWLHEHEDEIPGGIRPVCDLFTAPEDCQTLVERLLGADIFGLLVDDVDVATQIARRLLAQTDAKGQVSLFPLDLARRHGGDADPVGERLVDRLSFADEARPAIYALLGDVRLVSDLDEAAWALRRNATPCRYLTSDGVVVWPNGKISLGAREDDAEGVLARKERRETLRRELSDSDEVLAEGAKRLATLQDALSATRRRDVELSQSEASLRGDLDSLRSSIARGEQTLSRAQAEHDSIVSKRAELASRRRQAQPLEQEARSRIEKLKRQVGELEEKLAAGSDERHLRLEQEKTLRTRLSEVEVEKATLETRMGYLEKRIPALERDIEDYRHAIDTSYDTQMSYDILSRRVDPLYHTLQSLATDVGALAGRLSDQAAVQQADSASLVKTIDDARARSRQAKETLDAQVARLADLRVEKGRLETQTESVLKTIVETYDTPVEVALELPALEDRDAAQTRAETLRRKMEGIGRVNQVAMEEYEALKQRHDYIQGQLDDLQAARSSLERIVAAIDKKMRSRFVETFAEVDANFQQIFSQFFPGGNAHLSLTEPDTPETSGVAVYAQPHGKRILKMSLMSGGEKSLTALALLFAVYRTRTVPFYVLDEVDTALDDTNLRRLVKALDVMRRDTQFIVITHARRTMEMADVLYGVSMQADGVSKVVSQKLERIGDARSADDPEQLQEAIDRGADVTRVATDTRGARGGHLSISR